LTVTHISIGQAVIFFGKDLQALCEQSDLGGVDGDLAGLGGENTTLYSDDIADIELLKALIFLNSHVVTGNVALNFAL
jgi:hypothetical protein